MFTPGVSREEETSRFETYMGANHLDQLAWKAGQKSRFDYEDPEHFTCACHIGVPCGPITGSFCQSRELACRKDLEGLFFRFTMAAVDDAEACHDRSALVGEPTELHGTEMVSRHRCKTPMSDSHVSVVYIFSSRHDDIRCARLLHGSHAAHFGAPRQQCVRYQHTGA